MKSELVGGLIALIVAVVTWVYNKGRSSGKNAQRKVGAEEAFKREEVAADEELADKRGRSFPERVADARRRARARRDSSKLSG